jgi:hypothetical protein
MYHRTSSNFHTFEYPYCYAHIIPNTNQYHDSECVKNRVYDPECNQYTYAYPDSITNTHGDVYIYCNIHAYCHSYTHYHPYKHTHCYPIRYTYSNPQ